MVDSSLKFHDHVDLTITKENHTLGLINRSFQYKQPDMIIRLYKSLVRPKLDYVIMHNLVILLYCRPEIYLKGIKTCYYNDPDISQYAYQQRLQFLNLPSLCYPTVER